MGAPRLADTLRTVSGDQPCPDHRPIRLREDETSEKNVHERENAAHNQIYRADRASFHETAQILKNIRRWQTMSDKLHPLRQHIQRIEHSCERRYQRWYGPDEPFG